MSNSTTAATRRFSQVDVFTDELTRGNALAVVHDADGLSEEQMQRFAHWTQLAETVFLCTPSTPGADYRLRIFTPMRELPFAGHPTLGAAHAWLAAGGTPADAEQVVQECGAGAIAIRRIDDHLFFAAPPLIRSGPLADDERAAIAAGLGLDDEALLAAAWADNGPGWAAVRVADADTVLAIEPDYAAMNGYNVGVIGPHAPTAEADFEVRALIADGEHKEDPVTGSLNAALAQWLIASEQAPRHYVARQGARLGRRGVVHIETDDSDTIWVGGRVTPGVDGRVVL